MARKAWPGRHGEEGMARKAWRGGHGQAGVVRKAWPVRLTNHRHVCARDRGSDRVTDYDLKDVSVVDTPDGQRVYKRGIMRMEFNFVQFTKYVVLAIIHGRAELSETKYPIVLFTASIGNTRYSVCQVLW